MSVHGRPDFIVIGAQKAGTSWLDQVLRDYPDIWLPPVKELHYFDHCQSDFPATAWARLRTQVAGGRHWRRELANRIKAGLRYPNVANSLWAWRYFFARRDDRWYRALFDQAGARTSGEITPEYSLLDEAAVADLATRFAATKAFLLIREPIARTWSHVKMDLRKAAGADARIRIQDDLAAFFKSSHVLERADYPTIIERWQRHFGARFFWAYTEDVQRDPQQFINTFRAFIGLPNAEVSVPATLFERIGVGEGEAAPSLLVQQLQRHFRPMVAAMQDRFGRIPPEWQAALRDEAATP